MWWWYDLSHHNKSTVSIRTEGEKVLLPLFFHEDDLYQCVKSIIRSRANNHVNLMRYYSEPQLVQVL